jgi:hypothetical protein
MPIVLDSVKAQKTIGCANPFRKIQKLLPGHRFVPLPVILLRSAGRRAVGVVAVIRQGAEGDEVTEEWRRLHDEELHALYSSPDVIRVIISRRLRWIGHVARVGESADAYMVLVGKPEGWRSLGRPKRRWEDNIKMDV